MRKRLLPSVSNCETTEPRAPRPKLTMAMKALTPIASPSAVSALRPGLRSGTESAMRTESGSCRRMDDLRAIDDVAVANVDGAKRGVSDILVVRDQQHRESRLVVQLAQQLEHLDAGGRVERARGL